MTGSENVNAIIGFVSHMITCGTLVIVVVLLRGFVVHGISVAVAEFFIRSRDEEMLERMCRWFGNGSEILSHVKKVHKTVEKKD